MPADPTPTSAQRHILRHTLGLDRRTTEPFRNHYCANPGDQELAEMARQGWVELVSSPNDWLPYDTYRCTEAGRRAAKGLPDEPAPRGGPDAR